MEDIKPKLSKKDKEFLEGNFWIVRDEDGTLYKFKNEPKQKGLWSMWRSDPSDEDFEVEPDLFEFITWESGKAWNRQELRELEVRENENQLSILDQVENLIMDKISNDKGHRIERFIIKDMLLGYPESYILMIYKPNEEDIIRKGFKNTKEVADWLNENGWNIKEK